MITAGGSKSQQPGPPSRRRGSSAGNEAGARRPAPVTFSDARIDRSSPTPLYAQLEEVLEQEILNEHWLLGDQLPGELEICEHFGLSRSPVRQALARLEQRALIVRKRGKGTFVDRSRPALWLLQTAEGFFQDEVGHFGRTVTSRVLQSERRELPPNICEALDIPHHSNGMVLERLRSLDGHVALYVTNYLREDIAVALNYMDRPDESLYRQLYDRMGIKATGGYRTLQALAASEHIASLLELSTGEPVAFIESVSWDSSLKPFDFYQAWVRTDRIRVEIHAMDPGPALEVGRGSIDLGLPKK